MTSFTKVGKIPYICVSRSLTLWWQIKLSPKRTLSMTNKRWLSTRGLFVTQCISPAFSAHWRVNLFIRQRNPEFSEITGFLRNYATSGHAVAYCPHCFVVTWWRMIYTVSRTSSDSSWPLWLTLGCTLLIYLCRIETWVPKSQLPCFPSSLMRRCKSFEYPLV